MEAFVHFKSRRFHCCLVFFSDSFTISSVTCEASESVRTVPEMVPLNLFQVTVAVSAQFFNLIFSLMRSRS